MADKNRNGIPDELEKRSQAAKGVGNSIWDMSGFGGGKTYKPTNYSTGILGEFQNFLTDNARNLDNFWDSAILGNQRPQGGGLGDYRWGSSAPAKSSSANVNDLLQTGLRGPARQPAPPMGNTELPDFMSFLRQAMNQVGDVGRVSYDPLRNDARQRGTEYDARLEAMYNQLAGSLRDDAKSADTRYQGAIDQSADRSADAQQKIQMASNAADDRNAEVLRNLGIEEAQGNIINQGRDLNTQTAGNVADAAARGQITGDALQRNQQSSVDYSNNIAGAAGLEGNLQRARVQSELANLLAQYDMQEQEANRQAQQQFLSQSMGLAGSLYDDAWRKQSYEDELPFKLLEYEQAQNQPQRTDPMQYSMNFISQLMQNPEFQDLDIDQILKILGPAASIGKLAN